MIRWTHGEDPGVLQRPESLRHGRSGAMGGLGDPFIERKAEPALGVVEAPEKCLKHRQGLGGVGTVSAPLPRHSVVCI